MDMDREKSEPSSQDRYLSLILTEPDLFVSPQEPGIRILTDPCEIEEVEKAQRLKLAERSLPESWANIGIVFEDQYIQVLRDAVEFPGGSRGTYIRVLPQCRGFAGVAILPVFGDKIVLVRHFRHATRAWHWEIPRGFGDGNETCEQTAARELSEEIGAVPTSLAALGGIHTNTGLLGEYVVLFLARIDKIGMVDRTEGINSVELVNLSELEQMISRGQMTDSFTLAALLMAGSIGLLTHWRYS